MFAILATLAIIVQQTIATYSPNRPAARSSHTSRDVASNDVFYDGAWVAPSGSIITELDSTLEIPNLPLNPALGVSSHFKYLSLLS